MLSKNRHFRLTNQTIKKGFYCIKHFWNLTKTFWNTIQTTEASHFISYFQLLATDSDLGPSSLRVTGESLLEHCLEFYSMIENF